jgi:glycosyltransferase involved in cell wall biosynthesis
METLKFLMVTTHFPPHHLGGDAVFVEYLSNELSLAGHEVHVLTFPGVYSALRGGDAPSSPKGTASDRKSEHEFRPYFPTGAALASLMVGRATGAKKELESLVERTRPDIVHWHNTKGFIAKPFVAGAGKNVYTAHDYYAICPRSNLLRPNLTTCGGPYNCISCHLRWRKPPPLSRGGTRRVIPFDSRMTIISPSSFMAETLEKNGIGVHHVIRNFVPRPSYSHAHDGRSDTILYAGML